VNLQITIRQSGDVTIVDLKGRMTIGEDNDLLSHRLRELVANGVRKLLLNLAEVTQLDSSGICTIAEASITLSRYDGSLALLRPRDRVREVLEVMHLTDRIRTFEDESRALASFQSQGRSAGA
jgi:anti-sigma B factor antagonist